MVRVSRFTIRRVVRRKLWWLRLMNTLSVTVGLDPLGCLSSLGFYVLPPLPFLSRFRGTCPLKVSESMTEAPSELNRVI